MRCSTRGCLRMVENEKWTLDIYDSPEDKSGNKSYFCSDECMDDFVSQNLCCALCENCNRHIWMTNPVMVWVSQFTSIAPITSDNACDREVCHKCARELFLEFGWSEREDISYSLSLIRKLPNRVCYLFEDHMPMLKAAQYAPDPRYTINSDPKFSVIDMKYTKSEDVVELIAYLDSLSQLKKMGVSFILTPLSMFQETMVLYVKNRFILEARQSALCFVWAASKGSLSVATGASSHPQHLFIYKDMAQLIARYIYATRNDPEWWNGGMVNNKLIFSVYLAACGRSLNHSLDCLVFFHVSTVNQYPCHTCAKTNPKQATI